MSKASRSNRSSRREFRPWELRGEKQDLGNKIGLREGNQDLEDKGETGTLRKGSAPSRARCNVKRERAPHHGAYVYVKDMGSNYTWR